MKFSQTNDLIALNDEELITEVRNYINQILSSDNYDFVVCIERRGLVLYNDILNSSFPFFSEKAIDNIDIRNKKILVFDDSIKSGARCSVLKEILLKNGAEKVDVSAYVKLNKCGFNTLESNYLVNEEDFEIIRDRITSYMDKRLTPPDADHINIYAHLKDTKIVNNFENILKEIGETYIDTNEPILPIENNKQHSVKSTNKFGVYANKLLDWRNLSIPFIIDMPSWKVRINFTTNGLFCIVPIAFPELSDKLLSEDHKFPLCICKKYNNIKWKINHQYRDPLLACYCITINSQLSLIIKFLSELNKKLLPLDNELILDYLIYNDGKNLFTDDTLEDNLWRLTTKNIHND